MARDHPGRLTMSDCLTRLSLSPPRACLHVNAPTETERQTPRQPARSLRAPEAGRPAMTRRQEGASRSRPHKARNRPDDNRPSAGPAARRSEPRPRTGKTPSPPAPGSTRGKALIEPHGGVIVTEFFDIDKSRSIPPQRRPEASKLLAAPRRPQPRLRRGGGRRAAAGVLRQPVRQHVPAVRALRSAAVGARGRRAHRPGQRGPRHDHVHLRQPVQRRAQPDQDPRPRRDGRPGPGRRPATSAAAPVRVPADRRRAAPNPAKAADGKRLYVLAIDPNQPRRGRADLRRVPRRYGIFAIAERLTHDGIPWPSAHDRARNRHRLRPGLRPAPSALFCPTPATPAARSGTASAKTKSSSTSTTSRSATRPRCGGTTKTSGSTPNRSPTRRSSARKTRRRCKHRRPLRVTARAPCTEACL